jgi:hypothetical protein
MPMESAAKPQAKSPEPLWNSGLWLAAMLGLYSVELIARRHWKLL